MTIQWFPGHMAKARREVTEKLSLIDVVIELVDARVPLASRNPMIDELTAHKPRLILLNKADLADPAVTTEWVRYFEEAGMKVLVINSQNGKGTEKIAQACRELASPLIEKLKAKGMKPRAIRAMILGIPNVGKSTLINRLASKRTAKVGDRPGVTKQQQWIKVGKTLELLDTPGILWPKFEDQLTGYLLAATGAIKDELLDFQDIALFVLKKMKVYYQDRLKERYKLDEIPEDPIELFDEIGKKRGCLMSGGYVDYDKAAEIILRELRAGTLGPVTLERVEE
ncbi:ribosome biogenesis GTPase YlqF [Alkalihalobacillus hemicellulosilyticus]|uniref:Ribosome biogenesis GTPase A n=1 Tax=Halalkalibacter hemicellulosilyticusJCM 9152 TaxID=1236971 RepID=W4QB34_9BACI|nr:ribosome biogenesis GTPase YlqF [Halalkalibacter hemicellulosilyticus]GAE29225.1 50S ribosomal subunit maturation GTPase RbgA [Halalkalibacter hemicellulosilyticusJCM 9152]